MKLRQLAAFIRVCELGSITRAASVLHIAQPALGLQIRSLEADFGAALIVRGPRGVRLTPAGELVLAWAQEVLRSRDALARKVREVTASARPTLKIGLTPGIAAISRTLLDWAGAPESPVSVNIVKAFSHNIARMVGAEQLDMGFSCNVRVRAPLVCTPFLEERLYFLSAPDRGTGPIPLAEVFEHPIALPDGRDSVRFAVDKAAQDLGVTLRTLDISALETARDLAAAGIAGSVVPFGAAHDATDQGLSVRPIV